MPLIVIQAAEIAAAAVIDAEPSAKLIDDIGRGGKNMGDFFPIFRFVFLYPEKLHHNRKGHRQNAEILLGNVQKNK